MQMHNFDAPVRPLHLAAVRDAALLTISLSDLRSIAIVEPVAMGPDALEDLARSVERLHDLPVGNSQQVAEAGSLIFRTLFPGRIGATLHSSPPRELHLQLSAPVTGIAWELAFDGTSFLGTKFSVSRYIAGEDEVAPAHSWAPLEEACRVLLVSDDSHSTQASAYQDRILNSLRALKELSPTAATVAELSRGQLHDLIAASDVVHCTGSPGGARVLLADLAALAHPPRLVVYELYGDRSTTAEISTDDAVRLCADASRIGINVVIRATTPGDASSVEFIIDLYRHIVSGMTFASATQQARAASAARSDACRVDDLLAMYCGDSGAAAFARVERDSRDDSQRQITIMSHDLVNSTQLIARLGAEEYTELLERYHGVCARIVRRYGGISDEPQGDDGIMCYFGTPLADEDASAQSIRAALEIVQALEGFGVGVRVGISTGRVVIRAGQPVGVAVHLAARLQSVAEPGTIVVSNATQRLTQGRFEFEPIASALHLKGIAEPIVAFRVVSELRFSTSSRFDAALSLTPFIGRDREVAVLEGYWQTTCRGAAQAVLLTGEAGIGKSRLVREFKSSLAARETPTIECRCSPYHTSSAFYPVIGWLRRLLEIQDHDAPETRLAKIEDSAVATLGVEDAVTTIATLLSVPLDGLRSPPKRSPEKQRQLTLDVLVQWIKTIVQAGPLCVFIEDVQWLDPSSREFLERLMASASSLPLMTILTLRTEAVAPRAEVRMTWGASFPYSELPLRGLSSAAARTMVLKACGDARLSQEMVRLLAEHADGVPLFIEESTRMAVEAVPEQGELQAAALLRSPVPPTIHDLLMARLDRVAAAKQIAQVGATIGREFSRALIESVLQHEAAGIDAGGLRSKLDMLVQSGLLVSRGGGPDEGYFFKHALVRDTAYQSLWERDRQRLHCVIANVVQHQFAALAEAQPELLAYHYTEGRMAGDAVAYWEKAARRAAARSAHLEAITHLNNGLALVGNLPDAQERGRAELRMQLLLASRLIATEGYGAERVERVYARAEVLARQAGDEVALTKVQLGLEGYHFMRADFDKAHAITLSTAAMVIRSPDPMPKIQSMWAVSNILFHQGEVRAAVDHMDDCLRAYQRIEHRPGAVQDPGVMCLCYSAWGKWELGYPDEALRRARQVVALAEKIDHRFSMGEAWGFCTTVHYFRGEYEQALRCAERAIEICEDSGFVVWLAHAKVMHGRLVAELAGADAGVAEMQQAYQMWSSTGAVVTQAFYLAMQAEGLSLAGKPDEGIAVLDIAFDIVQKVKERYYEAEIRRLRGELMLQSAVRWRDAAAEAEQWFTGALELAREKELRSLALRSAMSLAQLWRAQGRGSDAQMLLEKEVSWFSEGLDTSDLRRAHRLMRRSEQTNDKSWLTKSLHTPKARLVQ